MSLSIKSGKNESKRIVTSRNVTIVKHFNPNVWHSNYCELPEVDNAEEIENRTVVRRKFVKKKPFKNKNSEVKDETKSIGGNEMKNGEKGIKVIVSPKPRELPKRRQCAKNTPSKSSLTSSSSNKEPPVTEKPKQPFQKSKSFCATRKNTIHSSLTKKVNNLISLSGSLLPERDVDALKQEILTNRSDNSALPYAEKLSERQQRVDSLRKEIGKFIEVNLSEKTKDVAALKSEIGTFRANRNFQVYHVREVSKCPDEASENKVEVQVDGDTRAEEETADKPSGSTSTAPVETSETDDR
ncbi:unnamed protein product [Acanthoscelides obtectus]|uniref:Uncharacterized protein n=1 Tax=Acanthoscelides obtectus TaxID=200917 RepID=A0A9P0JP27_ACAOB|nr:unnamed protein product [Acanthoscelides obtectus]CAH1957188.1 unnamed protein product [Acanthoscelides obtectus]CAK1642906.1 hypothetical protein AOBTE_LOCUS13283 [Acanthoscelides obtectus]CAK1642907.1 hypothetical protein AOBTE_LOCUS13283 [Acanthoscelides obtectus]